MKRSAPERGARREGSGHGRAWNLLAALLFAALLILPLGHAVFAQDAITLLSGLSSILESGLGAMAAGQQAAASLSLGCLAGPPPPGPLAPVGPAAAAPLPSPAALKAPPAEAPAAGADKAKNGGK